MPDWTDWLQKFLGARLEDCCKCAIERLADIHDCTIEALARLANCPIGPIGSCARLGDWATCPIDPIAGPGPIERLRGRDKKGVTARRERVPGTA